MLLCLDVGNSHLCGGVFNQDRLLFQFRYDSRHIGTSDQIGVFMRSVLRENGINYTDIKKIGIASVVPSTDYSVRAACIKYFNLTPIFLEPGIKTGVQIQSTAPDERGADLIAGAIAAKHLVPNTDVLIFDLGTATTCCYINSSGDFIGAAIAPGIKLMMESLQLNTARLFGVEIVKPELAIGKTTRASIQSGIYYAQLGLIEQLISNITKEYKLLNKPVIFASGGFSHLFTTSKVFDKIMPELVLIGIRLMLEMN